MFCDHICVTPGKICDGRKDCVKGEDEVNCKKTASQCVFGACGQLCDQLPNSKVACKCAPGYMLMEDGFSCRSNATDEPYLIYTNRYDIKLVRLQKVSSKTGDDEEFFFEIGRQIIPLISHLRNAITLDYYYNRTDGSSIIFWSDITYDQIYKGHLHRGGRFFVRSLKSSLKNVIIRELNFALITS